MSRNLQEYVAERVIEYLRSRDEEIKELKRLLKLYGVIQCDFCHNYAKYDKRCEICGLKCCLQCNIKIETHPTTNMRWWGNVCENEECKRKYFEE